MKSKIYKALSVILAFVIAFSVCVCAAPSTFASDDAVYYVSATGDDANAGTTDTEPLLTVNGAVKKANAENYGAGDVVTIKVMGTDAVSWGVESQRIAEHSFKLVITSAATDGSALVGEGTVSVNLGGDVEFDNIKVNFSNKYNHICGTGHNVTFNSNCVFNGNADMAHYTVGAFSSGVKGSYDEDITFVNNIGIKRINVLNNYSGTVLNSRLHIIYNYASIKPKFYLSTYDNKIAINNAINIEIKASNGADFVKYSGGSDPVFGENGYLQIINSGSTDIVSTDSALDAVPNDKLWLLNNKIGAADLLSITETKGKFKVNTEIYSDATATSITDSSVVITEKDGYLTLPAGEYNITANKIPQYTTYYVSANGSDENDGKTANTAVTSVQKALELANGLGFISTDNVTVKLLGENVNMGDIPKYAYNLVIEGEKVGDTVTTVTLNGSGRAIANCTTRALTTYKTVEIYLAGQWSHYDANDSNLVLEADTKFKGSWHHVVYGTYNDGGSSKTIEHEQTVVMKTAAPQDGIGLVNFGYGNRTYNENVNLVFDHASGFRIRFNTYASSKPQGYVNYNANVNLYLNNLLNIKFTAFEQATFNAGLNIFNNCDFILYSGLDGFDDLPENTWILNNNTDVKVPIIATKEAGQYTTELNWEKVKITAVNTAGQTFEMQNGILDLEEPGTYEIYLECKGEHNFGEYVDDNNAYCEKNATQTAYCEYCNKSDSREIEDTALIHIYSSETDKICDRCSQVREIEGNYLVKDSLSGEWVLYEDGTISFGSALAKAEDKWLYVENGKLSDKTLLVKDGEEWFYVVEGEWDETFTDIIEYQGKNIYIKDGKWDAESTSFVEYLSETLFIENGVWNKNTGFVKYQDKYFYLNDGKWDNTFTSFIEDSDKLFYVKNGEWDTTTGIVEYNNEFIYLKDGVFDNTLTGLVNLNNEWLYIKDGKFDNSYTEIIKCQSKYIYVNQGKWDSTVSSLIKYSGKWFYIENGLWSKSTNLVKYNGKWFYITKGKWDSTITDLVKYNGKWFYVEKGKWTSKTDLVKYKDNYFYVKGGKWDSSVQTLFKKNNKWFAVKSGKWYKAKGIVYYSGSWFLVDGGFAQLKVSGKVKIGSKTYTIKSGKVVSPKLAKPKAVTSQSTPAPQPVSWTPTELSIAACSPAVLPQIEWTPTYEEQINTEIPRILCWGDSITHGMGMDADKKYPSVLQQLIGEGYKVYNGGASGEKSYTIAARQGAYEVYLDKDIVFDAGVSKVYIGEPYDQCMELADGTKIGISKWGDPFKSELTVSKVYINGEQYRFYDAGVGSFYLERSDATEALTLAKGSLVEFESQRMQQGSFVEIFYVGANDGISSTEENITYLINRYKDMIERHGNDNYIVIVPQWDAGFSEAFKEEFGDKAVDIRLEMCSRDLSTVGLVPTEDDLALQNRGIIPTALKYNNDPTDSLHLNEYGYKMMANIIYERGVGLGYWK